MYNKSIGMKLLKNSTLYPRERAVYKKKKYIFKQEYDSQKCKPQ